jgi:hypothetical protein
MSNSKTILTTHTDKDGNYFVVKYGRDILTILLKLVNDANLRELGVVNTKKRVLVTKRNPEKHLFLKNNSYGFNEYLITTAKRFDHIHLIEKDGDEYLFPKDLVIEKGSYLHFKTEGFEKQLFLQLSDLKEYKIKSDL